MAAEAPGYSMVTIVGVVVVPGEERRVRLEVTRTDDEESVTETINAELQASGVDGGWVVPADAESLPLLRGTIDEVAALFPVVLSESYDERSLLLDAAGPVSVVTTGPGAAFGRVQAGRLSVVPRWGLEGPQGSVRLAGGDRASSRKTGESGGSWDSWLRGALTLGGSGADGKLSGFISIDHGTWDSDGGSAKETAVIATTSLAATAAQSVSFVANGSVRDEPIGEGRPAHVDRTSWSIRGNHAWQLSGRAANSFDLSVTSRSGDFTADTELRDPVTSWRNQSVVFDESLAWLPGSRLRHEVRAGVTARIGLDERLTVVGSSTGSTTIDQDRDEGGFWLEDELLLDRLLLRAGFRVDRLNEGTDDTTEVAPRIAVAWQSRSENPVVLRGSWGRFHESGGIFDVLVDLGRRDVLPLPDESASVRVMRTDRAVVGASSDLSGFAAWSLDVVSSKVNDAAFVQEGRLRFGDIDRLEVTLGGRLDLFGKADALLAWTWSDAEDDLPGWELPEQRGSLALRVGLPAEWAAAAIVRYDSGLPTLSADTSDASTTVDASLSKSFVRDHGAARLAIEAFNVTGDEPTDRSNRPARSLAVNVSYRFGE